MSGDNRQPRPPKDMKGLLKFCLESTKAEDAPPIDDPNRVLTEMSDERKKWLEEALENMSVDIIKQLMNGIKVLNSSTEDLDTKEEVLDCLEDWLCNIDTAINFHKVGGFDALLVCMSSPHPSLRAGSLHLVAELGQNNPYCQEKLLDHLATFLNLLDTDMDPQVQVKALYAISCLVRDNTSGLARFSELDGWSAVIRAVMREDENNKLRTKACFLITSAAEVEGSTVVTEMVSRGLVSQLVMVLTSQSHQLSHEHLLKALTVLVTRSEEARREVSQMDLKQSLVDRVGCLRGREEFRESVELCEQLLRSLGELVVSVRSGKSWSRVSSGDEREIFSPGEDWQEVLPNQSLPPGCLIQLNLETGTRKAKRDPDYELPPCLR